MSPSPARLSPHVLTRRKSGKKICFLGLSRMKWQRRDFPIRFFHRETKPFSPAALGTLALGVGRRVSLPTWRRFPSPSALRLFIFPFGKRNRLKLPGIASVSAAVRGSTQPCRRRSGSPGRRGDVGWDFPELGCQHLGVIASRAPGQLPALDTSMMYFWAPSAGFWLRACPKTRQAGNPRSHLRVSASNHIFICH